MRARRWLGLTAGAAALAFALAACTGDPGESPSPTDTATTSAPPTAEPSPTATEAPPVVAGPPAVPSAPAAPEGLLDELGPGYFLVDLVDVAPKNVPGKTFSDVERQRGFLAVVTPDRHVYKVADLTDLKISHVVSWSGAKVGLIRDTDPWDVGGSQTALTLDLSTLHAKKSTVGFDAYQRLAVAADGVVGGMFGGESTDLALYVDNKVKKDLCYHMGEPDANSVTPDGKQVVCFTWTSGSSQTAVVVVDTASPYGKRTVNRLKAHPFSYYQLGWVKSNRMLFSKVVSDNPASYYTLDLKSGDVKDFDLPFIPAENNLRLDFASQTFVDFSDTGARFIDRDGLELATVTCGVAGLSLGDLDVEFSGDRALVRCGGYDSSGDAATELWMVDLASGAANLVGSYLGVEQWTSPVEEILGYPND